MSMTAMDLVADTKQNSTKIDLDVREPAEYTADCLAGGFKAWSENGLHITQP